MDIGETIVKPDERKVEAINKMPPPEDKKGGERLLGMVNYLAKFIPNMSKITQPIREVLKKDVEFRWGTQQEEAFQKIKEVLTASPVLGYYNVRKPVTITCDASKSGLGAVLLQENKPVAYASRALTDAETRYAQIEKELLAVVFGFETGFNQYTYARRVEVESDHKPLEAITRKPLTTAPPRLQRMLLRLQRYDFIVKYKPGKEMVLADTLSRAYLTNQELDESQMDEDLTCHVHSVLSSKPISEDKLEQIKKETDNDQTMKNLSTMIRRGWPETKKQTPKDVQDFWNYRDEISEADGILLKGEKIIAPQKMRNEMLARVHDSHMGMERSSLNGEQEILSFGQGWDSKSTTWYPNAKHAKNFKRPIQKSR